MATEDESVYELSRRIDLFIGFGSAIGVLIAIFTLLYIGNESQEIRPIVGIASLSVISIFFLISYFLVNTVNLTNDKIVFLPCGHEILLSDIDLIKNASEFRSEAGENFLPALNL